MFHPIIGNRVGRLIFSAWWIVAIAIHYALLFFFYDIPLLIALADAAFWNILFAGLSLGLWFWVRISDFETQRPLSVFINHLGAAAVSILLAVSIHRFVLSLMFAQTPGYIEFLDTTLPERAITGLFFYLLIILVYYLTIYIINFRVKVSREAELKALVKDAELSWLKLQVNPHFLFNSLNSVSSLTMTSPEKAQEMITRLSELLRYSLKQTPDSLVPLSDELDNCKKYLEIEKVRFGSRLMYTLEASQSCFQFQVPSMILQPLFENAIKHSVAQSADESIVEAFIHSDKHNLVVNVSNSLPDFPSNYSGTGVGLENIRRRLLLVYGSPNLISVEKTKEKFAVTLTLPIHQL